MWWLNPIPEKHTTTWKGQISRRSYPTKQQKRHTNSSRLVIVMGDLWLLFWFLWRGLLSCLIRFLYIFVVPFDVIAAGYSCWHGWCDNCCCHACGEGCCCCAFWFDCSCSSCHAWCDDVVVICCDWCVRVVVMLDVIVVAFLVWLLL